MDESRLSHRIDMLARAGAMSLAVMYGSGFVVVTLHQARFGISAFDLLKPKIFASGFTFCALVCLATLTAFRFFRRGWWNRSATKSGAPARWETISNGIGYFVICEFAGFYVPFLFRRPFTDLLPAEVVVWQVLPLIIGIPFWLGALWLNRRGALAYLPKLVFSVMLSVSAVMFTSTLYRAQDRSVLLFAVWFFGTGVGSILLHQTIISPEGRLETEWERQLPLAFFVVSFYAAFVYPNIRPALGGGGPVHVVFYFDVHQPLFDGQILETNLLEENEHGYYVTADFVGAQAYFIRRDSVAFIKFEQADTVVRPTKSGY